MHVKLHEQHTTPVANVVASQGHPRHEHPKDLCEWSSAGLQPLMIRFDEHADLSGCPGNSLVLSIYASK